MYWSAFTEVRAVDGVLGSVVSGVAVSGMEARDLL